jgi:hypothetical protein
VPSYTSTLLEAHRKPDGKVDLEDEYDIKGSAGTLYAGESIEFCRGQADLRPLAAAETVIVELFRILLINKSIDCCRARNFHASNDQAAAYTSQSTRRNGSSSGD